MCIRDRLNREFSTLEKAATKDFRNEAWPGRVHQDRRVDIRYRGQGYEPSVAFSKNLLADFQHEHQRRYGYAHPGREVELVTLRLRAIVKSPTARLGTASVGTADVGKASVGTGTPARPGRAKLGSPSTPKVPVVFDDGKKLSTAIYSRDTLKPGQTYSGPAIITEYSATTVIPPRKRFQLDRAGNLIVTIR